jgi:hypothetical protein
LADFVITGDGDIVFPDVCRKLLTGDRPAERVLSGGLPELSGIELPYSLYTDADIKNRVIYVEASRGCPFTCEFCLSSLDIPVRQFDHERVLRELDTLHRRGARTFKFVDRTFNLNVRTSIAILRFFLERMEPGLFVHFEMVPDRFPPQLREVVREFPAGSLQFEVGIQTFDPAVSAHISRRQDVAKIAENLTFLRQSTGVYIHADLIAGLPGENMESFASGFDKLVALDPHEIQVGILKRLRGTPIVRHGQEFRMVYNEEPPYEILSTRDMSFEDLQRMGRFARYWDLVSNSGNFPVSKRLLWEGSQSPFAAFMRFTEWLYGRTGQRAGINLKNLAAFLFEYLVTIGRVDEEIAGRAVAGDYMRGGRYDLPSELRAFRPSEDASRQASAPIALKRQKRASR